MVFHPTQPCKPRKPLKDVFLKVITPKSYFRQVSPSDDSKRLTVPGNRPCDVLFQEWKLSVTLRPAARYVANLLFSGHECVSHFRVASKQGFDAVV